MNGQELDRAVRAILARVTRETVLTETRNLVALGFGHSQAFVLLCAVLSAQAGKGE